MGVGWGGEGGRLGRREGERGVVCGGVCVCFVCVWWWWGEEERGGTGSQFADSESPSVKGGKGFLSVFWIFHFFMFSFFVFTCVSFHFLKVLYIRAGQR